MGLDLTYESEEAKFTHRFSHADWATIDALRAHLPNEVAVCFDIPELGESVRISKLALKHAAYAIDSFLADNAQMLPATYQFKLERLPGPGSSADHFTTGGTSGLRLPNDPDHVYWIHAGLNELLLGKMAIGADGKGSVVEERDMRNETELMTESAGKVQFRRRAAKTTLRRALKHIAAFADKVVSEELTKMVG